MVAPADIGCEYVYVVCVCALEGSVQLFLAPSTVEDVLDGAAMSSSGLNRTTFSLSF